MLKTRLSRRAIALSILGFTFFVAGCGSLPQQSSTGFNEATQIAFLGNDLVGASIQLSKSFETIVTKGVVQKADNRLFGVKRDATSPSQMVLVEVKPGLHQVKVSQSGRVRFAREVFVSEGQTTRVEVTP